MANAGLSIGNPELLGLGIGSLSGALPKVGLSAEQASALGKERAALFAMAKAPETETRPTNSVYRSADGKRYAVGGRAFDVDDYASAVNTEKFIGQAFTPQEAGWEPVDEGSYRQFLERIKNPTTSELFGRNVDIGVANGKQLLGSLAQFLGAEEFGAGVVKSAGQDIAKLEPFQRGLGSIKSAEDMGAFVVANLGQQVPNLIASLVSAGAGAAVGGSLAAGRGALVRGLGVRLSSKEGQDALRTTLTRATQKHLAGEALDKTEQEALKFAGRAGGAAIGAAVQNYTMGVADIYGETQEQGADTVRGRMAAILGGIPYAALETLPELAYAKALVGGGVGKTALKDITGVKGKAGELLKRGGKGAAKGAGLEAVTEAGQEVTSLLSASAALGFTGKPLTSNENLLRIAEAAAAGAAVGSVLGGASNLRGPREAMSSGEPVNLITDVPKAEEPAPTVFMGLKLPEGLVPASASIALNRPVWEQGPPVAGPTMPRGVSPIRGVELPPNRPAWVDNLPPELQSAYNPLVPVAGLQMGGGLAPYTGQPEGPDVTGVEFNFGQPALPAPAAPAAPMAPLQLLGTPDFVAGPQGMRPAEAGDVLFGVQGNVPPGAQAGSQGLLDIFGGQPVTAEELAARMMPSTAIPMGAPPVEPVRNPQQGALQFAPAAPESWGRGESTQMRRGLEQLVARGRNAPLFAEQEAARAAAEEAARQARRDADYQAALNQVELQLAENLPNVAGPVAPAVIPTPQPIPTGAKGAKLKRGKSQEQAGKREDTEGRGRLAVKREDRNKPAEDQKAGGAPSGGRGAEQGAEKGKGLTPIPASPKEIIDSLPETTKEKLAGRDDNPVIENAVEFGPPEEPTLVNRRNEEDLTATGKSKGRAEGGMSISGGTREGDIVDPEKRKEQFDSINYAESRPRLTEDLGEAVMDTYPIKTLNNIAVMDRDEHRLTDWLGAHLNGGVAIVSRYGSGLANHAYVIAHELGHAAHSLLGDKLNKNPKVRTELKAVENMLYPNLRDTVIKAEGNYDNKFFNYLLSPEELIAEFNVYRLGNPALAMQTAPTLFKLLSSVDNNPQLVKKRGTFPTVFLTISNINGTFAPSGEHNLVIDSYRTISKAKKYLTGEGVGKDVAKAIDILENVRKDANSGTLERSSADLLLREIYKGKYGEEFTNLEKDIALRELELEEYKTDKDANPKAVDRRVRRINKLKAQLAAKTAAEAKPAPTPAAPAGAMGFVAKPKPAGKTKLTTAKETAVVKKPEVVIDSSEPVVQTTPVTTPVSGYELVKQTLKEAKSAKEEKKPTEAQVRYATGLAERIEEKAKDFKPREAVERASYEQETLAFVAAINASSGLDAQNGDAEWAKEVTKRGVFDQLNLSKIKNVPTGWLSIAEVEKLEKAGRKRGKGAGNYKRVSDNADAAPIGIGRVKMLVNQFVSKLKMKPTVYVYADINDLKVQNPELYRRAKAARVEGDFDNTLASGYSFGKNIIIFSNNIFSADHLNFVMAHETIGHFGMRSLMSGRDFDALMNEVYESSGGIRNAVDAAMASSGMSKSEAVEEYLADFAGTLNNNLLARVWAAIKNALNKLGVKFADDMARYLISQSRRYVYEGKTGNTFVNSAVALRMMSVESGEDTIELGRYSGKPNLRDDNLQAALMANYTSDAQGMNYDQLSDFIRRAKAAGMDFGNSFEKFKEKFFSLLNFRTRENPGLSALHDVLSAGRDMAMSIKVLMNERMAVVFNRAIKGFPSLGGITEEELNQVNRMLYEGQRYAISKYKSSAMGKTPLFYVDDEGQVKLNPTEAKRLTDLGMLKFEQMRDGFSYNVTYLKEGKEVTEKINVDGVPGLTTDSPIWKGYEATRESMADVELKLLQARYTSFIQESKNAYRSIAKAMRDATLTSADNAFLEKMYNTYKALWISNPTVDKDGDEAYSEESMTKANEFLAKMNELIIANESDKNVQLKDVLVGTAFDKQYDDLIASLTEFKQRFAKTKDREFLVQNKLKEVLVAELSNLGGDKYTKTSLATGYLPLLRKGDYQVRVVAYDKEGNPVRLKPEYVNQLSYTQHETESDALEMADLINNRLFKEDGKKKYYELEVFDENTGNYKSQNVELRADVGAVLNSIAAPPSLNLNEFIHGLRRFSIVLTPNKMEQVIVALTKQDNKARKRLQRSFVPGADMDGVAAVSQHIDSRASTIAKVAMRPQLNALMDRSLPSTMDIWKAEEKVDGVPKLKYLKDQWDRLSKTPDATPEQVTAAKRAYYEYKYMVDKTKPEGRASRDNMYYSEASRLLTFLDSNKSLDESDFGAGKVVSSIRAYTSMMQLGGSLATGALNYIGLFTNSFPYLATYNEKTAFGEGFGYGNAVSAFSKASSEVGLARAIGNSEFNTSLFYDRIAGDKRLRDQYGLTEAEAKFMAQEIREGVMIPAQSNALANTARGRIASGAGQKLMDAWMWTFNSTEQAARRSLGLATFRLAYNRAIASKMSEAQAIEQARKSAVDAIRYTMGEYSVINRPPAWRSGLQSFLYMYKVYPTTTIQTLARLSRTGQIQMLAGMWLLSGLAGMPFAEDFEDLLDTIAQKLGLSMGSVRFELAKLLDSIAPGVSPYLLKGVFNSLSPADIASRVSTGDFIPGTEILLAGADVGQQVKEILGPAASAMIGAATSMGAALSAATTEKTSIADVFREAPVTMMRAMGDAYVYAQTGTVLDKKGYVVTPDVSMMTILARMGGFYPASASEAYETIKLTNRVTDYQREVSGSYKRAWVKAMIGKDPEQARRVEEAVREWNVGAKGTGLEIRDFVANARRALKEAERPAKERSLRAVGKAAQATIEELDTLLSYPTSQP